MYLNAAIDALVSELQRQGLKSTTIAAYEAALRDFAQRLKAQGIGDVRTVRTGHIEAHQHQLLCANLKPRTVAQRIGAIRRLFGYMTTTGQLLLDPSEGIVALAHKRSLPRRHVTEGEMQRLLSAPDTKVSTGIRDRALLELLYSTAMRIGEALSLDVTDVDLELGLVRIERGKGDKGRMVPLGAQARHWLRQYLEHVRPGWMMQKPHERRLFVSQRGTALSISNVHASLRRHCEKAELQRIYPHAIRHAAATHMLRRGADLRAIQKLLGHAHLRTTQFYTRVAPEDVKATHTATHPIEVEA